MHSGFREILSAGGPVLILLGLLSVFSIGIILERFNYYRKALRDTDKFLKDVKKLIRDGRPDAVIALCDEEKSPAAKIIAKVLHAKGTPGEKREYIGTAIDWQLTQLQKKLPVLATIGSTSPFIGLFGTVVGVMKAFKDLSVYSGAGASVVAAGIAEALVNTAAGLFVAIPAIFAYNYFAAKTNHFTREMEYGAEEVLNMLITTETPPARPEPPTEPVRLSHARRLAPEIADEAAAPIRKPGLRAPTIRNSD
ncbi:MAG: MotA/TolQ/ExbB proton channel family protein [Elusimicrobiaceae bacterium]